MSLSLNTPATPLPALRPRADAARTQYIELKANVHRKLLNRLNLEALASVERRRAESEIRTLLFDLIAEEGMPLSMSERDAILGDVIDEVFGLGPLEPLLRDPTVSDILVNTYKQVYVERSGQLERLPTTFQDDKHLMRIIDRIVGGVGRRVDDSSPMVDARLPDGSRVNAIIPPLAVDGPLLSIRRFPAERLKAEDLLPIRSLTRPMLEFLEHCVRARLNMLISGGTGAGKTTLLNVLSSFIPDASGSSPSRTPRNCSCSRSTSAGWRRGRRTSKARARSGSGSWSSTRCVCGPTASSIGEVRGEEALDMLQAMNTGHDGSLTTVHANTPRDALSRIETMISMGAMNLPERAMRQQIASAIQIVVQQTRMSDGTRKVTSIAEITGMEGDVITMQEIFCFEKLGVTQEGKVIGRFRATGVRPKACERLKASGVHLPADMFEGVTEVR